MLMVAKDTRIPNFGTSVYLEAEYGLPQGVSILIPGTRDSVTFHGKGE